MEGSNGKSFSTSQYAHVTIGNSTRTVPFIACSTARFTEVCGASQFDLYRADIGQLDFNEYKNRILADDLPLPTKNYLISKIDDINKLINHQFTAEEIQQKLERSGVIKARYATIERAALLDKRRKAESRGDAAVVAKCNAELAELDGPKLAFGTSLYKEQKNSGLSQQERLAELNRANRKANTEDVRKAQRAEKRAEAENRLKVERGDAVPNPFARVKTRPRTNYDASGDHLAPPKATTKVLDDLFEDGSKNNSRSGTPARSNTPLQNGAPAPKKNSTNSTPQLPQEKVNGLPKLGRRAMDDDIIGAMDLGIEIDI